MPNSGRGAWLSNKVFVFLLTSVDRRGWGRGFAYANASPNDYQPAMARETEWRSCFENQGGERAPKQCSWLELFSHEVVPKMNGS